MIEEGATADADENDFDAADFEHLGQSKQLKRMREGSSKDAMVVQRPKSFKKKLGFPHALLQHMNAFPHALLLCRVGHFYEVRSCFSLLCASNVKLMNSPLLKSYFDQAIVVSNLLKIKLTVKKMEGKEYPMCGVPIAQLDKHLETLVREHNQFVAICEEIREYNRGVLKSLKRKVTRVVTPGELCLHHRKGDVLAISGLHSQQAPWSTNHFLRRGDTTTFWLWIFLKLILTK